MEGAWESPVRRRLVESQPVFGCTITTTSLDLAARAARAGFHFLWLRDYAVAAADELLTHMRPRLFSTTCGFRLQAEEQRSPAIFHLKVEATRTCAHQKDARNASCMIRGSLAVRILPKFPEF
jgi:hypothetical protein